MEFSYRIEFVDFNFSWNIGYSRCSASYIDKVDGSESKQVLKNSNNSYIYFLQESCLLGNFLIIKKQGVTT